MNIVYAIKILVAFTILIGVARVVAGPGLRAVMTPGDWSVGWRALVITMFITSFGIRSGIFFIALAIWAPILANMLDAKGPGRLLAYALLLPICPPMHMEIDHIGPIQDLMQMTPSRVLEFVLLAPEALALFGRKNAKRTEPWMHLCDLSFVGYMAYSLLHSYGSAATSVLLRQVINQLVDVFLPYYVISRACVDGDVRRRTLSLLLMAGCYVAVVGIAETASGHYFYQQFQWLYHEDWQQGRGLVRNGLLRAQAAYLGPLALSVMMMFSLAIWAMLKPPMKTRAYSVIGFLLALGLAATFGRGPWLATLVLVAGLGLLSVMSGRRFLVIVALSVVALAICWKVGIVDQVIEATRAPPGADPAADFNILYRQQLLTESMALLEQSPWWGVPNFMDSLQDLKQGEGIVDLVNTYLVVALNVGAVGLVGFLTPYLISLWQLTRRHQRGVFALGLEGPTWIAFTVAMLAVIFTVSPVSIIGPVLTWTLAFGIAHLRDNKHVDERRVQVLQPV